VNAVRANSYVIVFAPATEPQVGIIRERISPHQFVVAVGAVALTVSRRQIVRMKPRQRRAYRKSQRGN
jgi:hypothetical protein